MNTKSKPPQGSRKFRIGFVGFAVLAAVLGVGVAFLLHSSAVYLAWLTLIVAVIGIAMIAWGKGREGTANFSKIEDGGLCVTMFALGGSIAGVFLA